MVARFLLHGASCNVSSSIVLTLKSTLASFYTAPMKYRGGKTCPAAVVVESALTSACHDVFLSWCFHISKSGGTLFIRCRETSIKPDTDEERLISSSGGAIGSHLVICASSALETHSGEVLGVSRGVISVL